MYNLTKARNECGLTQQDVADMLYVAKNTVSQWETGKRKPDIEIFKKLSALYNTTIDYLVNERQQIKKSGIYELNNEEHILISQYNLLNEIGKQKVNEYVNDIVSSSNYVDLKKEVINT